MNPLELLRTNVLREMPNCMCASDHAILRVLDAFRAKYEPVTVRSLGGSLEIGRPNNVPGGHNFCVSEGGGEAVPALMLKRKQNPPDIVGTATALLNACERGDTMGDEMDALRGALSELPAKKDQEAGR